jgi:hypothetical protein
MKIKIDEQNLFTTKSYVSIHTLSLHNRKVSINQNTAYSFLRGMFPLGIETILDCTFSIPFQAIFYLNSIFQTSYV